MNTESFRKWLDALGKAWMDKKPEAAANICAKDVAYYETPFGEPLRSHEEIVHVWADVPNSQKDIEFSYEIITVNENLGVARWLASFTRLPSGVRDTLDGIFIVKLDHDGLCTEFHQWWVNKPK